MDPSCGFHSLAPPLGSTHSGLNTTRKPGSAIECLAKSLLQCNIEEARLNELCFLHLPVGSWAFSSLKQNWQVTVVIWGTEGVYFRLPETSDLQPQLLLLGRCSQLRIICCCLNSAWESARSSHEIKFYFSYSHLHLQPACCSVIWEEL